MKKSNFVLVGLLPILLAILVLISFVYADFGPMQSIAHKASAAVFAMAILNGWLRYSDLMIGVNFKDDIQNVDKNQRVVYYRTRLIAYSALIGVVFAFA